MICPRGERLRFEGKVNEGGERELRRYRCQSYKQCPVRALCSKWRDGRRIEISPQYGALLRQRAQRQDLRCKAPMRQRSDLIEPVFAGIKQAMGFRRWTVRGLDNVRTQWALLLHRLQPEEALPTLGGEPAPKKGRVRAPGRPGLATTPGRRSPTPVRATLSARPAPAAPRPLADSRLRRRVLRRPPMERDKVKIVALSLGERGDRKAVGEGYLSTRSTLTEPCTLAQIASYFGGSSSLEPIPNNSRNSSEDLRSASQSANRSGVSSQTWNQLAISCFSRRF